MCLSVGIVFACMQVVEMLSVLEGLHGWVDGFGGKNFVIGFTLSGDFRFVVMSDFAFFNH